MIQYRDMPKIIPGLNAIKLELLWKCQTEFQIHLDPFYICIYVFAQQHHIKITFVILNKLINSY